MNSPTDTLEVRARGEGTSQKAVPPQSPITLSPSAAYAIKEAENRRDTLQLEHAVNLGIGFVMHAFGKSEFTIRHDALMSFTREFRVTSDIGPDNLVTIKVEKQS